MLILAMLPACSDAVQCELTTTALGMDDTTVVGTPRELMAEVVGERVLHGRRWDDETGEVIVELAPGEGDPVLTEVLTSPGSGPFRGKRATCPESHLTLPLVARVDSWFGLSFTVEGAVLVYESDGEPWLVIDGTSLEHVDGAEDAPPPDFEPFELRAEVTQSRLSPLSVWLGNDQLPGGRRQIWVIAHEL